MKLFSRSKPLDANSSENDLRYFRGGCAGTTQWFYSPVSSASLQKTGILQWLSGDWPPISEDSGSNPVSVETPHARKARYWRAFLTLRKEILQNPDWLAGAGGFEPPHGGIKIPCLTTWRRPNSAERFTARPAWAVSRRSCRKVASRCP